MNWKQGFVIRVGNLGWNRFISFNFFIHRHCTEAIFFNGIILIDLNSLTRLFHWSVRLELLILRNIFISNWIRWFLHRFLINCFHDWLDSCLLLRLRTHFLWRCFQFFWLLLDLLIFVSIAFIKVVVALITLMNIWLRLTNLFWFRGFTTFLFVVEVTGKHKSSKEFN